jgi:DNA invertase Pin-like site-specific DNA recombinase
MSFNSVNPKITGSHLSRPAMIYVRQSSERQVKENIASAAYQRSFAELARNYGWAEDMIVVNDMDLGITGTDIVKREGFKLMRQQIFEERIGAVFCSEVSRLARDFSAFAQLIKLCGACNTLLIDEKGVYDPNNDNDLFTLGMLGLFSNSESRKIADHSVNAKLTLARTGELHLCTPVGYIYGDDDKLVFDPDEEIQRAVRLIFSTFERTGSVFQVVKFFNDNDIKFPTRTGRRSRLRHSKIVWGSLTYARANYILHNPFYAGTYSFGRSKHVRKMLSAETTEQKKRVLRFKWDADHVITIHGAHDGYISWEQFIENQKRINNNRSFFSTGSGATRDGSALLQGILKCGICSRTMYTGYKVKKGKVKAKYSCNKSASCAGPTCFNIASHWVDKAICDALLEALCPAQIQIAMQAVENAERDSRQEDNRLAEAINRAKVEVNKTRDKYDAVDPRNRNVAEMYEKELEEKLAEVKRLETTRANGLQTLKDATKRLTDDVRQSLLTLNHDVRSFWECQEVTNSERKELLRYLINKVTLKVSEDPQFIDVDIHWVIGAVTTLVILKDHRYLHPAAVELMRKLAPDHTVPQIVDHLHQAGFQPAWSPKGRFTPDMLHMYSRAYGINFACRARIQGGNARGDGRYNAGTVAKMLNVCRDTVVIWCKNGKLDYIRDTPQGQIWIKISPQQVAELRKPESANSSKAKAANH